MRQAFTLIELIFVIVIIGLLSAVAVPKFLSLKQNAEVKTVIKTTVDGAQSAVEGATNLIDVDDNSSFQLTQILTINGKGWAAGDDNNSYSYTIENNNKSYTVAEINLSIKNREVNYSIDCTAYDSAGQTKAYEKCYKALGDQNSTFVHLTF